MAQILFTDQYSALGGAQRILVDLVGGFVRAGHSAKVLLPGRGPVSELIEAQGGDAEEFFLPGLTSGSKGASEKLRYLLAMRRAVNSIRGLGMGCDLLYSNGPRSTLPTVLAARALGRPAVCAVHLIHSGIERRLLDWCFRRPHVKLVSFCSGFAQEPFPNLLNARIIPNWVAPQFLETASRREQSRAELRLGNEDIAVGVLGRVSKGKGQRLFIEAAMPLLDSHENLRLFIAGGADFEDPQEEMDIKALAGDRVAFLPNADALPFLDALDVSVVPSIRAESFGLVAVESMARSVPVVATRRGGLTETILDGQTGYLVEPNESEMREAIAKLFKQDRESMGRTGRKRVEGQYSPSKLIPQAVHAVKEILG